MILFLARQRVLHALRACVPEADFTPCLQVRKRRFAYAAGSASFNR
jgi:hypothetical protein